ncbi:hypothetical protein IW261DRAFT_1162526 [Armillaria novae-zelandiae]|uniref:Uncharacterized protein n=1 Tax=Armillaria novae-zelandiae TaxID=153914 RepID=A0AA39TT57_9AGAR|nr:hypothetical protein IW261DRAFT_1162526 [Armillaria novae-zelandiae]
MDVQALARMQSRLSLVQPDWRMQLWSILRGWLYTGHLQLLDAGASCAISLLSQVTINFDDTKMSPPGPAEPSDVDAEVSAQRVASASSVLMFTSVVVHGHHRKSGGAFLRLHSQHIRDHAKHRTVLNAVQGGSLKVVYLLRSLVFICCHARLPGRWQHAKAFLLSSAAVCCVGDSAYHVMPTLREMKAKCLPAEKDITTNTVPHSNSPTALQ